MRRYQKSSGPATYLQTHPLLRGVLLDLTQRPVLAACPQIELDEWERMINRPDDLRIMQEAERVSLGMGRALTGTVEHPRLSVPWRTGYKDQILVAREPALPEHLVEPMLELHSAALDHGIAVRVVDYMINRRASSTPQLYEAWPRLFELAEHRMDDRQREAYEVAKRHRLRDKLELSVELKKAIAFINFKASQASLLPDNMETPGLTFKPSLHGDANAFSIDVGVPNYKLRCTPQYPY